jgi:hypothetical protein
LSGQIYVSKKNVCALVETFSGWQPGSVRSMIAQLSDREFEVLNCSAKLVIKTTSQLISYAEMLTRVDPSLDRAVVLHKLQTREKPSCF